MSAAHRKVTRRHTRTDTPYGHLGVVFRSADQELTTAGAYLEMASRLTEPFLLGLAVRNRVS
jgi:hypothetical protein